ncbi:MAG TPA: arsenate reductase (glutaredoxin) [Nitratifractor salsuginis]|uniref:Arsenate reductase (Glutaredoxin) n=1 Tax=Nitratifractor salsuginis TaxID=269261 RepID=A0A7V2SIN6_9BACT|nr:arsenate reductase (glutaredoxin) [Nitratifractor salsuginis]
MSDRIVVWHNPRCSKSRNGIKYLDEKGVEYEIRRYLDEPPTVEELKTVLKKLGMSPRELMRTKEAIYRELGLKEVTEDEKLIEAMAEHPRLIERPIVIRGEKAVVARPENRIDEIL